MARALLNDDQQRRVGTDRLTADLFALERLQELQQSRPAYERRTWIRT